MKQFSPLQRSILALLDHKNAVSGTSLGTQLHVSRTAIWKQIKNLQDMGLPILSSHKEGYRLSKPFQVLDEQRIRQVLFEAGFHLPVAFELFAQIDSTNSFLKQPRENKAATTCCLAEHQTAGRGRFNRHWYSPFGENIYFSSRWGFNRDLSTLGGLSLVVSLAIVHYLKSIGFDDAIEIKWPNDILWKGRKLCGTLIDIIAESNSQTIPIIGIGLNVNSETRTHSAIETPWCSLYDISGQIHDRNTLIAGLLIVLEQYLSLFMHSGFKPFQAQWRSYDHLANKTIQVQQGNTQLSGKASGVSLEGHLILKDAQGRERLISSGEASLQQNKCKNGPKH